MDRLIPGTVERKRKALAAATNILEPVTSRIGDERKRMKDDGAPIAQVHDRWAKRSPAMIALAENSIQEQHLQI